MSPVEADPFRPRLVDLPEPERPASPAHTARERARERFARRVVVDAVVAVAAVLRASALQTLDHNVTISEGGAVDDDLLTSEEEIATGVAAALQWCVEPTDGRWSLFETGAVSIDAIDLAAEERGVGGGPLRADDRVPGRDLDVRRGRRRAGARPVRSRRTATERLRRTFAERLPRSPVHGGARAGLLFR